jgi:hypothetical protein
VKIVTEADVHLHQQRQRFLRKFFRKTYEKFGEAGFVFLDNPPVKNDSVISHLSSEYYYQGRLFEPENRWYFSKEYLRAYDNAYYPLHRSEIDLKKIADVYHSPCERFVITAAREIKLENRWAHFAGFSLFTVDFDGKICEAIEGLEVIKCDLRSTTRAVYIQKGSQFAIPLPAAMVMEREYQRRKIYKINSVIHVWSLKGSDREEYWKVHPLQSI